MMVPIASCGTLNALNISKLTSSLTDTRHLGPCIYLRPMQLIIAQNLEWWHFASAMLTRVPRHLST